MKNTVVLIFVVLSFLSCKMDSKSNSPKEELLEDTKISLDTAPTNLDSITVKESVSKETKEDLRPQMRDSIKTWLDSVTTKLGTVNRCRISAVIGSENAQPYYSGYDGRANRKITDFNTSFELGGCTKMFTATSILQLVEEKIISLEDKLTKVLPNKKRYQGLLMIEGRDYMDSIKIINLLNHSSGLPDYFSIDENNVALYADSVPNFTPDQLINLAKQNKTKRFIPGDAYELSNTNYILLGLLIEKLTGQSYQAYIQENIIDHLDLRNTYFGSLSPSSPILQGHYKGKVISTPYSLLGSAGEIISNLGDMEKFIRAWYAGELFNNPSFMENVKNDNFLPMEDIIDMQYGMGVIKLLDRSLGHSGQTFGFQTYMASLSTPYRFAVVIDESSVDSWLPAVLLSNYLGTDEKTEEANVQAVLP